MGPTDCLVTSGVALLLCLTAFSLAETATPKCTTGFSVVAPEVAAPGKTTVVLVSLHGGQAHTGVTKKRDTRPVNVTLRLETQESDGSVTLLATASKLLNGHGIIPLSISSSAPGGQCTLHTEVDCALDGGQNGNECAARGHSLIRVLGPVRDVIVRPARHDYRPGDTVTFWVLALDHDLRLVSDVLGSVSLMDPAGTKVSIWEEVRLDEGVKKFTVTLSDRATAGVWKIHASTSGRAGGAGGGAAATVEVHVSLAGATAGDKDTSAAEQHYVELRFGKGMRRQYKPGLPFLGRVEAVSTEPSVRVRVKLMDHAPVYSQDVDLEHGGGDFRIPAVYATSETLYLQAELVSVGAQQIESHYVLAREPITRWNSTSKCYLLIEGFQKPLRVGETAQALISSTCACGETVLSAVTSDGRATHWGQRQLPSLPHKTQVNGIAPYCSFNYSFPVLSEMAPTSQLLVYYVTDDGEPISDVATFNVQLLHKEVAVVLEEKKFWYPRQGVNLRLLAEPGSTVCLIGGKPPTEAKFDPHLSEVTTHPQSASSGGLDVVSAGVSLCERRGCGGAGGSALYRRRGPPTPRAAEALLGADPADRLWMWKCYNYTNQLSIDGLIISAPSEAGRWSVWALSLSSRSGLVVSAARPLIVFRPIQVDFEMPPALKVGETVEVDVKIGNNINTCLDVTALLSLSGGASFVSNGLLYVTERLRLGPRGATSLVVRVAVATTGRKNITVEVTGYSAENCDVSYGIGNSTLVGSVVRSTSVLVQPEGLVNTDTESAYFCANEHLLISPPSQYGYSWVTSPRNRAGLVFEVRSQGTVRVALSDEAFPTDSMYYVVIEANTGFYIGRGSHVYNVRLARSDKPVALSSDSFSTYWVCWEAGWLSAGTGSVLHADVAVSWRMDRAAATRVTHVGFASDWGSQAEFRIWNFNDEAGFSQVLELSLPRGVVPGSAQGSLLVAGGLVLPHVQGFPPGSHAPHPPTSLVDVAAGFAPLLALEYTPHLVNDTHHENIMENLPRQIQTLMSFRKNDNSFSDHYSLSSHLSTITVLEVLSKTQTYYPVDPVLLESIKRWVQARQEDDGSFTPLPADIRLTYYGPENGKKASTYNGFEEVDFATYDKAKNLSKELQDLERNVEITAETVITLMEIGIESEIDDEVISKSRTYLENHLHNVTSSHPLAIMVYALVLSRSTSVSVALERLSNASTTAEGEFGWPHADNELPRRDAADWLYEEDAGRHLKTPILTSVEEYRASLFALLSRAALGDLRAAEPVARYLFYRSALLDRHPELLYTAVKAFSVFGALAYDKHRALTVSLATAGMELTDTLSLGARGGERARLLQLPGLPTKVFVYATGAGCATLQGFITYSTYSASPESAVLSVRSGVIEELRPERSSLQELQGRLPALNIKTCFKWKHSERSGALRLEISLFSGFELSSFNPVVLDEGSFAQLQHGSKDDFVWFAFANVSSICPVCITYQIRSRFIVSSLRPALARVWPAGRPDLAASAFFHARGQAAPAASPLLRGITDEDYVTWFGLTQDAYAARHRNDTVEQLCECGRICRNTGGNHEEWKCEKTTEKAEKSENITPEMFNTTESSKSPEVTSPTDSTSFTARDQKTAEKVTDFEEHIKSSDDVKNLSISLTTGIPYTTSSVFTTNVVEKVTTDHIIKSAQNNTISLLNSISIKSTTLNDRTPDTNHLSTINAIQTTEAIPIIYNSNPTKTKSSTKNNDNPKAIIIPTATLANASVSLDNQTFSNVIIPEIKHSKTDELIVQKTLFKKEWYKNAEKKIKPSVKVNFPRKKGTLKATYGDKHESFYKLVPKSDVTENIVNRVSSSTVIPIANISPSSNIVLPVKDQLTTEFVASDSTEKTNKAISKDISADSAPSSALKNNKTEFNHTTPLVIENERVIPSIMTTNAVVGTQETTSKKHANIETITNSDNDKATTTVSHMQTEIDQPSTKMKVYEPSNDDNKDLSSAPSGDNKYGQIASTGSPNVENIISASSTLSGIHTRSIQLETDLEAIMKNITSTEKHSKISSTIESPLKVSKSINKEIHQIPHAPYSETSISNTESVVLNMKPENRDGYVVLDKNKLWDILKEVVHAEMDKNEQTSQKKLKIARSNASSSEGPSL